MLSLHSPQARTWPTEKRGSRCYIAAGGMGAARRMRRIPPVPPFRRHDAGMNNTWSISDLLNELDRFEREARAAGLKEASVQTYVDRSRRFVRWLAGDFQFQGPH